MSRQCARCGHLADEFDHFCAACGAPLEPLRRWRTRRRRPASSGCARRPRATPRPMPAVDSTSVSGLGAGHAVLVVLRGPQEGARFDLDPSLASIVVGRSPGLRHSSSTTSPSRASTPSSAAATAAGSCRRRRQPQRHLRQPDADRPAGARRRRRGPDRQVPVRLPRERRRSRAAVSGRMPTAAASRGLMSIGDVLARRCARTSPTSRSPRSASSSPRGWSSRSAPPAATASSATPTSSGCATSWPRSATSTCR